MLFLAFVGNGLSADPLLVVIDSPLDGQTYGDEVVVEGVVATRGPDNQPLYAVRDGTSVVWAVLGTRAVGETTTSLGRFSFTIDTSLFSGNREVLVGGGDAPESYGTALFEIRAAPFALRKRPPDHTGIAASWTYRALLYPDVPEIPVPIPQRDPIALPIPEPGYAVLPGRNRIVPARIGDRRQDRGVEPPLDPPPRAEYEPFTATLPAALRPEELFPPPSTAPFLEIAAASLAQFYDNEVTIRGVVGDSNAAPESSLFVEELRYSVPGTALAGDIIWDLFDGSFSFQVRTAGLTGQKKVVITARNSSGYQRTQEVTLFDGSVEPAISFLAPGDGTQFGRAFRVSGRVVDPSVDRGQPMGIRWARFEVYASEVGTGSREVLGDLDLLPDGSFSFVVDTEGMFGDQVIRIEARGVNGAQTHRDIVLIPGGNDIPSFRATADDGSVTLRWEDIPGVTEYEVISQGPAGEVIYSDAASPYRIESLVNGEWYTFRLAAVGDEYETPLHSDEVAVVPLDEETLVPRVTNGFRRIDLEWEAVPAVQTYELFRSMDRDGPYVRVAEVTNANSYTDREVTFGTEYFYRVSPAGAGAVLSRSAGGTAELLPSQPLLASASQPISRPHEIEILGDYALVARADGIDVVDVYEATDPAPVGEIAGVDVRAMDVHDTFLAVADGDAGFKVFDLRSPSDPLLLASVSTESVTDIVATAVASSDDLIVAAAGESGGLAVYRIARTGEVSATARSDELGPVLALARHDDRIFGVGPGGIVAWSLSGEGTPQVVGFDPSFPGTTLAVTERRAYVGTTTSVVAVSLDGEGSFSPLLDLPIGGVQRVTAREVFDGRELLYITTRDGLAVYDVTDTTDPVTFGRYPGRSSGGVAVRHDETGRPFVYLGTDQALTIVDVYILGESFTIASALTPGNSGAVNATVLPDGRSIAVVGDGVGGVRVFDVSDPERGLPVIAHIALERCREATVIVHPQAGALVAAVDEFAGLQIFSLSQLERAAGTAVDPIAEFPGDGEIRAVAAGTLDLAQPTYVLAVADRRAGVVLFDFGDAAEPTRLGSLEYPRIDDLAIGNGAIYVADSRVGLAVAVPQPDGSLVAGPDLSLRWARSVYVSDQAIAVVGEEGLSLVDHDRRANRLSRLGLYPTNHAEDVVLRDTYAYLAEGVRGLNVVDINNPARPLLVSNSDVEYAVSVAFVDDLAVVVDGTGIEVVRVLVPDWLTSR